eukprot:7381555-Prymnesium_polylepis.2
MSSSSSCGSFWRLRRGKRSITFCCTIGAGLCASLGMGKEDAIVAEVCRDREHPFAKDLLPSPHQNQAGRTFQGERPGVPPGRPRTDPWYTCAGSSARSCWCRALQR